MGVWKLEDAKNQFSRLVRAARRHPQVVTRHGQEVVVVLSVEKYRELSTAETDLVEFLERSPLAEAFAACELTLVRSRDLPREIEL
jgi:prevent-host-death family protein